MTYTLGTMIKRKRNGQKYPSENEFKPRLTDQEWEYIGSALYNADIIEPL